MTGKELDGHVASLKRVGGVYDYVAAYVEHANAPHVEVTV
jgi:hypothetical protein